MARKRTPAGTRPAGNQAAGRHWLSRGAWQGIGGLAALVGVLIAVIAWWFPRSGDAGPATVSPVASAATRLTAPPVPGESAGPATTDPDGPAGPPPTGPAEARTVEPAPTAPASPPPFRSALTPDCPRAVVDLDVDRYERSGATVPVGEHADAYGMNQWSRGPGTLWVFLYQPGVGYFPADQKPSPEQGRWVSYRVTFGRDQASHPEDAGNVERSVILVLAGDTAVNTIERHLERSYGAPMTGLPAGTTRLRTVRTVRVC